MAFNRQPGYVNTVEDGVAALAGLFNSPAEITEVDDTAANSGDSGTDDVIDSLRVTVNELLATLAAAGLIEVVEAS